MRFATFGGARMRVEKNSYLMSTWTLDLMDLETKTLTRKNTPLRKAISWEGSRIEPMQLQEVMQVIKYW